MYEQATGLAALAAFYPPALVIAAVYLSSANPRKVAGLFLTGAVIMTAVAGVAILFALRAGGLSMPADRTPRFGLRLGIGVLAIAAAGYLTWRYRRRLSRPPANPGKPSMLSRMTRDPRPWTALVVGAFVFAPGVAFVAAVQAIATANAHPGSTALALVLVVVIYLTFGWLPLALYLISPDRTTHTLKRLNAWLSARGQALAIGALSAIGAILIINGAMGLALAGGVKPAPVSRLLPERRRGTRKTGTLGWSGCAATGTA